MQVTNEIKMVQIKDIKPYEHNARDNTKTVEKLVKIIPKTGFNVPLVLDRNNVIIKGHARYEAAKQLGMDAVPCVYSDLEGDAVELDRIADNKIAEFSRWKVDELAHEIDSISIDFDFSDVGIDVPSFDDEMPDFEDWENGDDEQTDEERRQKFEQYLREHQDDVPEVEIATRADVDRAVRKQKDIPKVKTEYIEIKCEECGETIYVRKDDVHEY